MKICNNELLIKVINIQACIIRGSDIKAVIHKSSNIYLDRTGADIITICMNDVNKIHIEHIFERSPNFKNLLKKYMAKKKVASCESIISNYKKYFIKSKSYHETSSLNDIFKGLLSKDEISSLMNEIQMKEAVIMPILDIKSNKTIGYVTYIFKDANKKDLVRIEEMNDFFQILIQPIYDYESHVMFSRCMRIDKNFSLLTNKEKRIIRKVLKGKTYVEIAEVMKISINTIKTHIKNIFNKYNVNSKIELYNKIIDNIL